MIEVASDEELSAQAAALAEFAALRSEMLQAFSTQWNIVALQLTATAVVFSFSLTNHSRAGFLLIIPIVSFVLNGRYLNCERIITLIGKYFEEGNFSKRAGGLEWGKWFGNHSGTKPYQVLRWLAHGPPVFVIISFIALGWAVPYIRSASKISIVDRSFLWIVWGLGFVLTTVSIYLVKKVLQVGKS